MRSPSRQRVTTIASAVRSRSCRRSSCVSHGSSSSRPPSTASSACRTSPVSSVSRSRAMSSGTYDSGTRPSSATTHALRRNHGFAVSAAYRARASGSSALSSGSTRRPRFAVPPFPGRARGAPAGYRRVRDFRSIYDRELSLPARPSHMSHTSEARFEPRVQACRADGDRASGFPVSRPERPSRCLSAPVGLCLR